MNAFIDLSTGEDRTVIATRKGMKMWVTDVESYLGKSPTVEEMEGLLELLTLGTEDALPVS